MFELNKKKNINNSSIKVLSSSSSSSISSRSCFFVLAVRQHIHFSYVLKSFICLSFSFIKRWRESAILMEKLCPWTEWCTCLFTSWRASFWASFRYWLCNSCRMDNYMIIRDNSLKNTKRAFRHITPYCKLC